MKLKSKLLIIAGSDSSGGAGIQADIKTANGNSNTAGMIMNRNVERIQSVTKLDALIDLASSQDYSIPVVDENQKLIGEIDRTIILQAMRSR